MKTNYWSIDLDGFEEKISANGIQVLLQIQITLKNFQDIHIQMKKALKNLFPMLSVLLLMTMDIPLRLKAQLNFKIC